MAGYRKWFDELNKVVKIIFSVFGIFIFLYRLFLVIEEKAKNSDHLIYLILNVIPIIGFVILIVDIIAMATDRPVPLSFATMTGSGEEEAPAPEEAPKEEEPEKPAE